MDWVNIGCLRMSVARVFFSLEASMVGIVEFDNESLDGFPILLHANQHASTPIGQPIQCIDVVHQHNLTPHLQLQYL